MSARLFLVIGVFTLLVIIGGYASAQMSSNDLDPATYKDHNDLLKEIASRVPEFGGAYSSNNGTTLYIQSNRQDIHRPLGIFHMGCMHIWLLTPFVGRHS